MNKLAPGIKRSVLVIAVLPAGLVALLLTLIFSASLIKTSEQSLSDRGLALVRQLAPASEYGVFSGNPEILQPLVDAILNEQDVVATAIRSTNGGTIIQGGRTNNLPVYVNSETPGHSSVLVNNNSALVFYAPIIQTEFSDALFDQGGGISNSSSSSHQRILGSVLIELSPARIQTLHRNIAYGASSIAILLLVVSAIVALRLGRSITDPVLALKTAISDIESGNFDPDLNTRANGELKSLQQGVKTMAGSLKLSRENLEERVRQSTAELRNTLVVLEEQNTQLDKARHQAEEANEAKTQFLAKISHEFRTPLNGICGFLQLLKNAQPTAPQKEYIRKIGISTEALLELIDEILDFSKIEVSEIQLSTDSFNLAQLLESCVDVSLPIGEEKGLTFSIRVDKHLPKELVGDANRLAQVIRNLVSNAVKFTDDGAINIHAFGRPDNGSSHSFSISVSDTGIGIAKEDQAKLFDPFTQLESAMTRRHGGTGLGLAISKSLVDLMQGSISVESNPESHGSCFTLTLPLRAAPSPRPECNEQNANKNARRLHRWRSKQPDLRALVADDNPINREFLCTWLSQIDVAVDEVGDGQQAIEKCQLQHYDIVFLDLHMPVLQGFEAASQIHTTTSRSARTPIIAVTADVTDNTRKKLSESDFDDFLIKPVSEEKLIDTLEKWCLPRDRSHETETIVSNTTDARESLSEAIDRSAGLSLASGNEKLWLGSLKNLAAQLPSHKAEIENACVSSDMEKIKSVAHNIIGAASYCGATRLVNVSRELRMLASQATASELELQLQNLYAAILDTEQWIAARQARYEHEG